MTGNPCSCKADRVSINKDITTSDVYIATTHSQAVMHAVRYIPCSEKQSLQESYALPKQSIHDELIGLVHFIAQRGIFDPHTHQLQP